MLPPFSVWISGVWESRDGLPELASSEPEPGREASPYSKTWGTADRNLACPPVVSPLPEPSHQPWKRSQAGHREASISRSKLFWNLVFCQCPMNTSPFSSLVFLPLLVALSHVHDLSPCPSCHLASHLLSAHQLRVGQGTTHLGSRVPSGEHREGAQEDPRQRGTDRTAGDKHLTG